MSGSIPIPKKQGTLLLVLLLALLLLARKESRAMALIAPLLEGYEPKTASLELKQQSLQFYRSPQLESKDLPSTSLLKLLSLGVSAMSQATTALLDESTSDGTSAVLPLLVLSAGASRNALRRQLMLVSQLQGPQLPKIGTLGICAMDAKAMLKPCRQILNRLVANGEFEPVIFGDKVILDELVENWPTCDFLILFFLTGFPLLKAIRYVNLRKPFVLNDLVMQQALWDRRLVLRLLDALSVRTAYRLEITRDGGPRMNNQLRERLKEAGVDCDEEEPEPEWLMPDEDTLVVNGQVMHKPFVEKPVDGEDHNVYIYYSKANGGGGRRLFRKIGNKSSEFDPLLLMVRTEGLFVYEEFMDTDNFEDVKAYTVGENYCHAETRKLPVVDGIVRRNTHGKEIRYVTRLLEEETAAAARICKNFGQTICGFDLLRVGGLLYVIDVNGFSFVKDNAEYYDRTAQILREIFVKASVDRQLVPRPLGEPLLEEKKQKWVFKGMVLVIRHADRTPKQKFKYLFRLQLFIQLLKGHKEEVIIRQVPDLQVVLATVKIAQEEQAEDAHKLAQLRMALEKKMNFLGTKVQLKPVLDKETGEVEKVQTILKWGGEPTHSAQYQCAEVGEQMRQNIQLLNKLALKNVKMFTLSERRVVALAQLTACALLDVETIPDDFLEVRKDLLDDLNAAKDLMDKVKKKLKPLLRQGKKAPADFTWPATMPEPFVVIKRVVELMNWHRGVLEHNFATKDVDEFQLNWCTGEDPVLFRERWDKLFTEFANVDKVDPSKILELYDTMKYDALHNRKFLQQIFNPRDEVAPLDLESLVRRYPVNVLAMNNFKLPANTTGSQDAFMALPLPQAPVVLPLTASPSNQPVGQNGASKTTGSLGWVLARHGEVIELPLGCPFDDPKFARLRELYLLAKVLFDFICPQEYGISAEEKLDIGLLTLLPLAKQILEDIKVLRETDEPGLSVYFTKELHIYTLLGVLYELKIPMRIARNSLPEFDYLSQIIFELYESDDGTGSGKKHALRLSVLPGCHTQNPLDIDLDERHFIGLIHKISLTRHLDMDLVTQKLKSRFSRVILPKKFTPVNISSPLMAAMGGGKKAKDSEKALEKAPVEEEA